MDWRISTAGKFFKTFYIIDQKKVSRVPNRESGIVIFKISPLTDYDHEGGVT